MPPREVTTKRSALPELEEVRVGATVDRFGKTWRVVSADEASGTVTLRERVRSAGRRVERQTLRGGKVNADAAADLEVIDTTDVPPEIAQDAEFLRLARLAKVAQARGRTLVYQRLVTQMETRWKALA